VHGTIVQLKPWVFRSKQSPVILKYTTLAAIRAMQPLEPLAVSKEETVNAFRKITGTFGQPENILHFEGYVKTAA
jgi:hypothetical protein